MVFHNGPSKWLGDGAVTRAAAAPSNFGSNKCVITFKFVSSSSSPRPVKSFPKLLDQETWDLKCETNIFSFGISRDP